jgi:hypothetical protein
LLALDERAALADKLKAEEIAAVSWAVSMVRAMAGSQRVLASPEECRTAMLGLSGTADAIIPDRLMHFDLKTGVRRNYREQMAAYALGLMQSNFAAEWTCHLLYCDLREVETMRFTFEEAYELVDAVIRAFHDPAKQPVTCDYCGWCAKADTCPARRAVVAEVLELSNPGFDFEAIIRDSERLGRFLEACSVLEGFRERAKKIAIEQLKSGASVPGWKLVNRKGPQFVDCQTVGHHIAAMGFGPVLAAYGNLSATKFRDLWSQRMPSDQPFPEDAVKQSPPTSYLKSTPQTN